MSARSIFLALAALTQAGGLGAQQVIAVPGDARIRVESHCRIEGGVAGNCREDRSPRRYSGRFRSLDLDTLRLVAEGDAPELAMPSGAVTRVWIAEGDRGHFLQGALIGMLVGGAVGTMVGSQLEICTFGCSPATSVGAMLGVPAGLVLGGLVGLAIRSPRWTEVDLAGWRASVVPALGP